MNILIATTLFFLQPPQPVENIEASRQMEKTQAVSEMATSRSVMIIDPQKRADDYIKAFDFLRQEKSISKIFFKIAGGQKISNVIDITPMPGNTLIIFRYNTSQGIKFQVVEIENILGIMHQ